MVSHEIVKGSEPLSVRIVKILQFFLKQHFTFSRFNHRRAAPVSSQHITCVPFI